MPAPDATANITRYRYFVALALSTFCCGRVSNGAQLKQRTAGVRGLDACFLKDSELTIKFQENTWGLWEPTEHV